MQKWNPVLIGLILLGVVLLVGATVWSSAIDPRDYWTQEDAQTRAEVGNEYHELAHHEAHAKTDEERRRVQTGIAKARARWEENQRTFQNARDRYERPARVMRYSGIALLIVGIVGYYLVRANRRD